MSYALLDKFDETITKANDYGATCEHYCIRYLCCIDCHRLFSYPKFLKLFLFSKHIKIENVNLLFILYERLKG